MVVIEQAFSPDESTVHMQSMHTYIPFSHSTDELYTGDTEPMPAIRIQPSTSLIVPAQDVAKLYESPVFVSAFPAKPTIEQQASIRWSLAFLFFVASCVFACTMLCIHIAVH